MVNPADLVDKTPFSEALKRFGPPLNAKDVPIRRPTDNIVSEILHKYRESDDKFPKIRGNTRCFLYDDRLAKIPGEPKIVLGPNWIRSLVLMLIINIGVGIGIDSLDHKSAIFHCLYIGMIFWNLFHIYLILMNPGLPPKDPTRHNPEYLQQIIN